MRVPAHPCQAEPTMRICKLKHPCNYSASIPNRCCYLRESVALLELRNGIGSHIISQLFSCLYGSFHQPLKQQHMAHEIQNKLDETDGRIHSRKAVSSYPTPCKFLTLAEGLTNVYISSHFKISSVVLLRAEWK
ncbi:hypothetical protein AMECASPLE_037931 [Ameca splendens]|uniref:Uncharacterized protein n=1 Tax=Ameca splendens TaxID=208324 RepID=A0ABV0ZUE1_9TELE